MFTPSPERGENGYNVWSSGDSSFINSPSTIVTTSIRPADSIHNTDSYVSTADCSSVTDHKGNITELSIKTAVGIYTYIFLTLKIINIEGQGKGNRKKKINKFRYNPEEITSFSSDVTDHTPINSPLSGYDSEYMDISYNTTNGLDNEQNENSNLSRLTDTSEIIN